MQKIVDRLCASVFVKVQSTARSRQGDRFRIGNFVSQGYWRFSINHPVTYPQYKNNFSVTHRSRDSDFIGFTSILLTIDGKHWQVFKAIVGIGPVTASLSETIWVRYVNLRDLFGHARLLQHPEFRARLVCGTVLLLFCAGCTTIEKTVPDQQEGRVVLLDPEVELGEDWENRRLRRGHTKYERVSSTLGETIQATGNRSASVLYRLFEPVEPRCKLLRWTWYVREPQPGSDLHVKGMDDVAASVFVLFGDPGIFMDRRVPALKYVWANHRHKAGEIIVGPYHKKFVRTIVVRTGASADVRLAVEQANLFEDFERAFGKSPENGIYGIGIFTDNDDTNEPIVSHYGRIELLCDNEKLKSP